MICLGIMSGSSLDGLDMAMVEFLSSEQLDWKLLNSHTFPLSNELKSDLRSVVNANIGELLKTQNVFTQFVSQSIDTFINASSIPEVCGIHGHTIVHSLSENYSWQMVNAGYISSKNQINVVADFRNQDIALGGQGAPMAVIADRDLFTGYKYYINLGGIANISYMRGNQWYAYDVCPFNQVLNYFANKLGLEYDENGQIASKGQLNQELLKRLWRMDYNSKSIPKSLDNQEVKKKWIDLIESFNLGPSDCLRTFIAFAAQLIHQQVAQDFGNIFITGGGAYNQFFIQQLEQLGLEVVVPSEAIIEYKEAVLMAYMAYLRISNQVNFINHASGSSQASISGALYLKPHTNA